MFLVKNNNKINLVSTNKNKNIFILRFTYITTTKQKRFYIINKI